jgi:hypothetical protein
MTSDFVALSKTVMDTDALIALLGSSTTSSMDASCLTISGSVKPSQRQGQHSCGKIWALSLDICSGSAEYRELPLVKVTELNSVAYQDSGGPPPPRPPLGALEADWGSTNYLIRTSLTFEKQVTKWLSR